MLEAVTLASLMPGPWVNEPIGKKALFEAATDFILIILSLLLECLIRLFVEIQLASFVKSIRTVMWNIITTSLFQRVLLFVANCS